jgi:hypothetical protein
MMNKIKNFFVEEVEDDQPKLSTHKKVTPLKSPIEKNEIESLEHSSQEVKQHFVQESYFNPNELEEITRSVLVEEEVESDILDEDTKEYEIVKEEAPVERFKFPMEMETKIEVESKPVEKEEIKEVVKHMVSAPIEKDDVQMDLKVSSKKDMRKFRPSPVISPVYGIINGGRDEYLDSHREKEKKVEVRPTKKKKNVSIDEVRQKAFGQRPGVSALDPIEEDTGKLQLDLGKESEVQVVLSRTDRYEEEGILEDIVPMDEETVQIDESDLPFDTDDSLREVVLEGDTGEINLEGLDQYESNPDGDSFLNHLFSEDELAADEEVFKVADLTLEEAEESFSDFGMEYDVDQEIKEKRFTESNPLDNHLENAGSAKELKEQMSLFYKMVNDEIKKGEEE